jgi:predicted RNA-binding Zn ribbon-like protein
MKAIASSAPGEERSIALALVNTLHRRGRAIVDEMAGADALRDWLQERTHATPDRTIGQAELERVRSLRDAIRALMHAAARGVEPPEQSLRIVNRASAGAPRVLALDWPAGGAARRRYVTDVSDPLDRATSEIATDAIELLTDQRGSELVECAGPGCVRFLLKDHPRRHWCSPSCGERARAARYYQRHRAGGS